jgi:hypothetical protein
LPVVSWRFFVKLGVVDALSCPRRETSVMVGTPPDSTKT